MNSTPTSISFMIGDMYVKIEIPTELAKPLSRQKSQRKNKPKAQRRKPS